MKGQALDSIFLPFVFIYLHFTPFSILLHFRFLLDNNTVLVVLNMLNCRRYFARHVCLKTMQKKCDSKAKIKQIMKNKNKNIYIYIILFFFFSVSQPVKKIRLRNSNKTRHIRGEPVNHMSTCKFHTGKKAIFWPPFNREFGESRIEYKIHFELADIALIFGLHQIGIFHIHWFVSYKYATYAVLCIKTSYICNCSGASWKGPIIVKNTI